MGLIDLFSGGIDKTIGAVGNAIDSLVTSDEERLTLKNELERISHNAKLQSQKEVNKHEAEITARNNADQKNGNFLTKSARPIFLYWIMAIITILIFGGLGGATVATEYISLIESLSITAVTFFFGSKGLEIYKHGKLI
ncbi:MAG: hypothetical protein GQ570_12125 [Helicobacteraceae bacterium]|nr:hypothetical protein [Helicobacteraceae bacterium]